MIDQPVIDISGFLKTLSIGPLALPVYFLIPSLAFIICLFWLVQRAKRHHLNRNRALDVSLVLMIVGFVFARLFHIVFEEPDYYAEDILRAFDLWRGGFVWYGGALFGGLASVLFLKWKREPIGRWLDLFAPIAAGGYAMGRLACLCVGCCYGRTFSLGDHVIRHPTQLYAVILELIALAILVAVERLSVQKGAARRRMSDGYLFALWVLLHGINRLIIEQFRDDPRGPALMGLSLSSWISLALIAAAGSVTFLGSRLHRNEKSS